MRIGLKRFLIVFTLIACAIGWYKNHLDAELGYAFEVPKPVKLNDFYEVPDSIREFRGRKSLRNHKSEIVGHRERGFDEELASASGRLVLSDIRGQIPKLLEHRKDGLLKIARTRINNKTEINEAAIAAMILDECGDETGLAYIRKRFLSGDPKDDLSNPNHQIHAGEMETSLFERLGDDAEFIDSLKLVPDDSPIYRKACAILYEGGVEEPLVQLQLKIAKEESAGRQIRWLLKHRPSKEVLRLALDYLTVSMSPFVAENALTVVPTDELRRDPEYPGLKREIELAICRYVKSEQEAGSVDSVFFVLAQHGTELSADAFRHYEMPEKPKFIYRGQEILSACQMLHRIGRPEDASTVFRNALTGSSVLPVVLYERAEEYLPRSEIIDSCMVRCRRSGDRNAMDYLSRACEGTGNQQVTQAILDATSQSSDGGFSSTEDLKYVRRIGHPEIGELWSRIPAAEKARAVPHFYDHWVTNDTQRSELVDWINQRLSPAKPLTVQTVLTAPKYKDDGLMWDEIDVWRKCEVFFPGIRSDHQFATMALAHSGNGNLLNPYWYNLIWVARGLSECADIESSEFQWTSHLDDSRQAFFISFVANDRVYKFSISNEKYYCEDRYSYAAAAELLNAVAIRQRLKGRFFCYETEWATLRSPKDSFTLVLYLEPKVAKELESKFGMRPMAGFEFYLNH